jgi:3',5'-cyclic AMP phosphodiesterase CpdA
MTQGGTIVQLSDPHMGADWDGLDPVATLSAVMIAVGELRPRPAAVLVSGDLSEHAADAEYQQLGEALAPIDAPVYVLPGNHDDRAGLRRHFDLPGTGDEPIQYAAEIGDLRLVVLDTKRNGVDGGELGPERLAWLETTLGADPDATTVLAMHHSPLVTGIQAMDAIGLPAADLEGLERVVAAQPQVQRLVGGHVHRAIAGELAGRAVLAAPSTYMQLELDFQASELVFSGDPPGFAVHLALDGEVVSHVKAVG